MNDTSKYTLAKLMSTEDISVRHKNVETASFDVKNRVMTLPIWKEMSTTMTEGLIGHETGHALWTPFEPLKLAIEKDKRLTSFINIIEDVRIERDIKKKFPGIKRTMYDMYSEFLEKDFFGIANKETNYMGLADRLNLHAKIGVRAGIEFTDAERDFVARVENVSDFDEVVELAKELLETSIEEKEEDSNFDPETDMSEQRMDDMPFESMMGEDSDEDGEDEDSDEDSAENGQSSASGDEDGEDGFDADGGEEEFDEPSTVENAERALKDMIDWSAVPISYVKIPKVHSKEVVVPAKTVMKEWEEFFAQTRLESEYQKQMQNMDDAWKTFKRGMSKEVDYLVKEFELKKAADAYKRTSISKTGVLDTTKMHTYKINEDIFRKVATVKDGKSHGLVMYVDWSGSMSQNVLGTIQQTLTLVAFAKKVGIPFSVMSFNSSRRSGTGVDFFVSEEQVDDTIVLDNLRLREFISSDLKSNDFNKQMYQMFLVGFGTDSYWYPRPPTDQLGSTPLNEAIVSAYDIVPAFREKYGLDNVNVVFLTDGESNGNNEVIERNKDTGYTANRGARFIENQYNYTLVDEKTRIQANVNLIDTENEWRRDISYTIRSERSTGAFLEILKKKAGVTIAGFFITKRSWILKELRPYEKAAQRKAFQSAGYSDFRKKGYDKYFVVSDASLNQDDAEFEPDTADDGSVNVKKLKTAFRKFNTKKRVSKMMLGEFINLIA